MATIAYRLADTARLRGDSGAAPSRAFAVAAVLAAIGLILTVVGPTFSHHYAEISPYHSHIYLSGETQHVHGISGAEHEHDGTGVVSVGDDSGAGLASIDIAPAPADALDLGSPVRLGFPIYQFTLKVVVAVPPDRPPVFS
jgi:hypothetical protein